MVKDVDVGEKGDQPIDKNLQERTLSELKKENKKNKPSKVIAISVY